MAVPGCLKPVTRSDVQLTSDEHDPDEAVRVLRRSVAHLEENVAAGSVQLADDEVKALAQAV